MKRARPCPERPVPPLPVLGTALPVSAPGTGSPRVFFFARSCVVAYRRDRCVRARLQSPSNFMQRCDIIRDVGGGGGDSGGRRAAVAVAAAAAVVGIFSEPRIETARLGDDGCRQWTRLSVPILWSVCANRKNTGPPHARTGNAKLIIIIYKKN